jgi:hypothetical protein
MRALIVTTGLAALGGAALPGAACGEQPVAAPCESFTRAGGGAPPMVHDWLARSGDDHVRVCPRQGSAGEAPAEPLYSGESAPTRHGAVCSYSHHDLNRLGHGSKSRLQRYDATEAQEMALAGRDCPAAHPSAGASSYIETYDVSPTAFEAIVHLWAAAAASSAAFDRALCCEARDADGATVPASAAARTHLRAAIDAGRMTGAPVVRIVRISGTALRHRFALIVAQPDSAAPAPALYVIYFLKPFGGSWHITGVGETAS